MEGWLHQKTVSNVSPYRVISSLRDLVTGIVEEREMCFKIFFFGEGLESLFWSFWLFPFCNIFLQPNNNNSYSGGSLKNYFEANKTTCEFTIIKVDFSFQNLVAAILTIRCLAHIIIIISILVLETHTIIHLLLNHQTRQLNQTPQNIICQNSKSIFKLTYLWLIFCQSDVYNTLG